MLVQCSNIRGKDLGMEGDTVPDVSTQLLFKSFDRDPNIHCHIRKEGMSAIISKQPLIYRTISLTEHTYQAWALGGP